MPGRKFPAIPGGRHKDAGCKPLWEAAVNFNVQGDGNVWITTGIYAGGRRDGMHDRFYWRRDEFAVLSQILINKCLYV